MLKEIRSALGKAIEQGMDAAKSSIDHLLGTSGTETTEEGKEASLSASQDKDDAQEETQGTAAPAVEAKADGTNDSSFWVNGVFQRGSQIGLYNFTTDPRVIGVFLNPHNRWIELSSQIFADTQPMAAIEAEYYRRVKKVAAETAEERYAKKVSYLVESEETKPYSDQLSFPALTEAHEKYSKAAPEQTVRKSTAGRKPVPFRIALGTLIIQSFLRSSDRETGKQISEDPYMQYFCGYDSFSSDHTLSHSTISELKKVFDEEFMEKINQTFLEMKLEGIHLEAKRKAEEVESKAQKSLERAKKLHQNARAAEEEVKSRMEGFATEEEKKIAEQNTKAAERKVTKAEANAKEAQKKAREAEKKFQEAEAQGKDPSAESQGTPANVPNSGTLILDATCCSANAKFPQDFDLVNDARKMVEKLLTKICTLTGAKKPRTNKKALQKEVKDLSKKKKRSDQDVKTVIKDSLAAIEHIFKCIDDVCQQTGYVLTADDTYVLMVAKTIYGQQKYMLENNVRKVPHRIVSASMPQIRPIVRGKTTHNYEFGPKTEISIDENGFVRLESYSYEAFNEGNRLQDAVERYKERTGHYPKAVLADQIYRTRENLAYCKEHGIRLSGPKLGRKVMDEEKLKAQILLEKADMVARIEVERQFSRQKRCWGLDCIMERTPERMEHAVGMGVLLNNLIPVGF